MFTSIVYINNLLVVADEQGSFYHLELSSDKSIEEVKKYNCRISSLYVARKSNEIFAVTDDTVDVYKILKGIKTVEGDSCHNDSIVGIYAI